MPRKTYLFAPFAGFFLLGLFAPAASASPTRAEAGVLRALNEARAERGLHPLQLDVQLEGAARAHSADMLRANYFEHGDFWSRMNAFHVRGPVTAENLAWGTGPYAQAEAIVAAWLASPPHRANLLRPGFTRVGVGEVQGSFLGNDGAAVVTADFAGS